MRCNGPRVIRENCYTIEFNLISLVLIVLVSKIIMTKILQNDINNITGIVSNSSVHIW